MYYVLLFFCLLATEMLYFCLANRFNIIDNPNERSSHTRITLRGGGIIFTVATLVFFLSYGFEYPWFITGLLLISGISFTDDIKGISQKIRLLFHVTATLLLFGQWEILTYPWYHLLPALIFCIGILNAYNFMDGINGITGGYSFIIIGTLWYINWYTTSFINPELLYSTGISVLVFIFFNFRKRARCFAGDVGSISIAFIILFILGKLIIQTHDLSYIILLIIYGTDSILTIIHRLLSGENILEAHRKHAYQILANELKLPHLLIATIYMLLQLLIFAGYMWLQEWKYIYCTGIVIVLVLVYYRLIRRYYKLPKKHL